MVNAVTAYVTNPVIAGVIGLVLGALFGTKIKDFLTGIPSEFRTAMNTVEAKAKADVKAATADVFSKLVPAAPKVVAPAAPPAPVVAAQTGPTGTAPAPVAPTGTTGAPA
jgi:hypothetical protein